SSMAAMIVKGLPQWNIVLQDFPTDHDCLKPTLIVVGRSNRVGTRHSLEPSSGGTGERVVFPMSIIIFPS
ncbi:MAG: hypothetical protein ACREVJ_06800, partial [Gammaproteobacteria bacterium]